MTIEELTKLMVAEKDPQKAKAIAEVIAAQQKAEAEMERARLENEAALEKVKADRERAEAEKEANLAKVEADKERARLEREAADQKAQVDRERTEAETKISKKDRILGIFKVIGTILLGLFTGGVAIFNARSVMKFEETGTIRSKAWTGVKPDKTTEIR